jgi:dienelactone hydrolase
MNIKLVRAKLLFCVLIIVFFREPIQAQVTQFKFNLSPGKYAVGFKSINQYDFSRTYISADDTSDRSSIKEKARPIQTSIWYPAVRNNSSTFMLYGEYIHLLANKEEFVELTPQAMKRAESTYAATYKIPLHQLNPQLTLQTKAVKNAAGAKGNFPVVIYSPGVNGPSFENSFLCEYLASHGYIVVASPSLGISPGGMSFDVKGFETQARDIEFLLAFMHTYSGADITKVASIGFSWGGLSNIVAKLQNDKIQAVICLDGSIRYHYPKFKQSVYSSDSLALQMPFLYMASNIKDDTLTKYGFDPVFHFYKSLPKTNRYFLTFNDLSHENFSSHLNSINYENIFSGKEQQDKVLHSYQLMSLYTLHFLNAYLKSDKNSLKFISNKPQSNGIAPAVISAMPEAETLENK